jgi:hypothetical protein
MTLFLYPPFQAAARCPAEGVARMAIVLKLSSQGQLTLPKALVAMMGSSSYFEAELVKDELVLRPGLKMTLAEAEEAFRAHGITRAVLREALRIVAARDGGDAPE